MEKDRLVSIIMPTLNSEKIIRKSLDSLKKQKLNNVEVEILVVDGGSTDNTCEIAKEYGAKIIPNPRVQPECAKHEGILHAKGKYAMFLDSDEELTLDNSVQMRIDFMRKYNVKIVLTPGYLRPDDSSRINDYINTFSDPFSFFMYGTSSGYPHYFPTMLSKYPKFNEDENGAVFCPKVGQALPLVDICAGNCLDLDFLRSEFEEYISNVNIVPEAFNLILSKAGVFGMLKKGPILHYSSDTFGKYIRKVKWRVIINTHYQDSVGVGFSNREKYQNKWFKYKKFLFIPYALIIVPALLVSLYYMIKRRSIILLIHSPLTFYVAVIVIYQQLLKAIKVKPILMSYGK